MKDSKVYAVGFTIGVSCLCAIVLTFGNTRWQKQISANENFDRIYSVVYTLGLLSGDESRNETIDKFAKNVVLKKIGEMNVYEGRKGEDLVGYALELETRGSYGGLIKGVLAVDSSKKKILDFNIYDQSETPGLGARCAERQWLDKFRNVPIVTGGVPGIIISSQKKGPNVIDGVAQASRTMYQLSKMLNMALSRLLAGGMRLMELDLGLDAVTRATPGYPKNFIKPPNLREEVKRPPFMVQPGTQNIGLRKPVISSIAGLPIIGEWEQITDGIKKSDEFDFVELDPGPQWVQVDLGNISAIYCVVIWHYYKNPIIYNDVIVQLADDEGFTQNVQTVFNNDYDNSSGLGEGKDTMYFARWWGEIVDTSGDNKSGKKARYVRVYTNGGASGEETRFVEIAVYGKSDQKSQ